MSDLALRGGPPSPVALPSADTLRLSDEALARNRAYYQAVFCRAALGSMTHRPPVASKDVPQDGIPWRMLGALKGDARARCLVVAREILGIT